MLVSGSALSSQKPDIFSSTTCMTRISIVFRLVSPLSATTIQTFDGYRFLVQTVLLPPLTLTSFKAMDVTLKIRTVLENRKCGFVPGKDNFDYIEVSIHTVHRQQTS